LAAGVLAFLVLSGCAWQVIPPAKVAEPVAVFLSEYGRHTRLALPDDSTVFFEYGFGEWNFYGLEKQGVLSALRAISGLGEGALSRRQLPYTLNEAVFLHAAGGSGTARLWVERSLANRLREELEARWQATPMLLWSARWTRPPFPATRRLTICSAIPTMRSRNGWNVSVAACLATGLRPISRSRRGLAPPGVKLLNHTTVRLSGNGIKRRQNHPDD
jgi:hypothetical protein